MAAPAMTKRPLFGGAMSMDVPSDWVDAADIRDVPDNQEMFFGKDNGATLIIELLGRKEEIPDDAAANFFFHDLADVAEATGRAVAATEPVTARPIGPPDAIVNAVSQACHGTQQIAKFRETATNDVAVFLQVIRLPKPTSTEIVLTLSAPQRIAPGSSDKVFEGNTLAADAAQALFVQASASVAIHDLGLFVPE